MKNFFKSGNPYVWLTASALTICLLMICGLVMLIMIKGLGMFWPHKIVSICLKDNVVVLGELVKRESVPYEEDAYRSKLKVGNRDVYGLDFKWINDDDIASMDYPLSAITIERREWGNMYGFLEGLRKDNKTEVVGMDEARELVKESKMLYERIRHIEKKEIGDINHLIEKNRIKLRSLIMQLPSEKLQKKADRVKEKIEALEKTYSEKEALLTELYTEARKKEFIIRLADDSEKVLPVFQVVRMYTPNNMHIVSKMGFYVSKLWEYVSGEPREANTEGGIFPAIFGTVMMVFIMSIAVVPLGVLTAIYLKEYASDNFLSRIVRIAVNNLAGVPSIVFGVFGLGFFIYFIGGSVDKIFFSEALPTPTYGTGGILWASLTLALLTVPVVVVATEEALSSVPRAIREGSYALGTTKFETLWKVVLPQATPGILTGTILAMARAAGEVAPLMITGVVKLAPSLPIDHHFPFIHLERKFMHLGFHIYDVGFQSPNVEAAIPMVYTTTLVLVFTVLTLNIVAIVIRNKLRKKYKTSLV
ncbi:MAG: phosphate ABC transporter permease PstA [Candidatus Kuenenia sp.]|nr:phosphate ABC transporter permease PstA [Candidatus Kuenenia hertensis]